MGADLGRTHDGRWRCSPAAARVAASPVAFVALAVLVANDHLLKARWPGPVTGIASDVAGLILLPIVVAVLVDRVARRPLDLRVVTGIAATIAAGFALVEVVPAFDAAYEHGLGALSHPLRDLAFGDTSAVVRATPDPADLLALPAVLVGPWLWLRAEDRSTRPFRRAALLAVAIPALLATSPAPEAHAYGSVDATLDSTATHRPYEVLVQASGLDGPHVVTLEATLDGTRDGNPPTLEVTARSGDGKTVDERVVGKDLWTRGLILGTCDDECSLRAEVRVEAVQPGPGWSGRIGFRATAGDDAEGSMDLKVIEQR